MNIRLATDEDKESWNRFVLKHSDNPCHLYEWRKILEQAYGYECIYLIAEEGNEIVSVFPTVMIRSKLFGTQICSLPFSDYGGLLLSNEAGCTVMNSFLESLSTSIGKADFLEVRTPVQTSVADCLSKNLERGKMEYVTFVTDLSKPFEEIWKKDFDKHVRNAMRKAIKNNLEVANEKWGENLDEFYHIYLLTMKKLGSPAHRLKFFKSLHDLLRDEHVKLFLSKKSNKTIGGVVAFTGRRTIYASYEVTDPNYKNLNPASLLFSRVIEWGCSKGYHFFDFGRTLRGSGVYNFKKQWGGKEISQPYYYLGKKIPQQDPREKYVYLSKLWGKLPISIAKRIGPYIKGGIGQ